MTVERGVLFSAPDPTLRSLIDDNNNSTNEYVEKGVLFSTFDMERYENDINELKEDAFSFFFSSK